MKNNGTESKAKQALVAARAKSRARKKACTVQAVTARVLAERIEQERNAIGPLNLSNLSYAQIIESTSLLEELINDYLRMTIRKSAR